MRRSRGGGRYTGGAQARRFYSLKEQYPVIFAFGEEIRYLTHEQAVAADVHQRIRSVWPFLVRTVLEFAETLKPRDAANYDPEDVLLELYAALVERDDKWEPERGRYLTFAGNVVANELHAVRDKSHTVHAPRNSSCRLKQYDALEGEGALTEKRRKTHEDVLRAIGDHGRIDDDADVPPAADDTLTLVERREEQRLAAQSVLQGLRSLTAAEARTVGRAYGLWGRQETPLPEIAEADGLSLDTVKKTKARAQTKIRERLEGLGHTAA